MAARRSNRSSRARRMLQGRVRGCACGESWRSFRPGGGRRCGGCVGDEAAETGRGCDATDGDKSGALAPCLANAAHVKNVPGRKTDVNDAMWLADLLAHGLIRASFVPPVAVQELRTLTRTRKQFVRERSAHVQRIEKVLEDANLKLSVVLSDILGKSGRAVLLALIDGQTDPERLVCLHRPRQGQPRRAARSLARARQRAPPLHAQAAPGPYRRAGQGRCRSGEGGGPWPGVVSTSRSSRSRD